MSEEKKELKEKTLNKEAPVVLTEEELNEVSGGTGMVGHIFNDTYKVYSWPNAYQVEYIFNYNARIEIKYTFFNEDATVIDRYAWWSNDDGGWVDCYTIKEDDGDTFNVKRDRIVYQG